MHCRWGRSTFVPTIRTEPPMVGLGGGIWSASRVSSMHWSAGVTPVFAGMTAQTLLNWFT